MQPVANLTAEETAQLDEILTTFCQADHVRGEYLMRFSVRNMPDSDNSEVIDVFLVDPDDDDLDKAEHHIQYLSTMVPARLLGYEYKVRIESSEGGENCRPDITVLGTQLPQPGLNTPDTH